MALPAQRKLEATRQHCNKPQYYQHTSNLHQVTLRYCQIGSRVIHAFKCSSMRVAELVFTSLLPVCYVLGAMAGLCIVVGDNLLSMVGLGIQASGRYAVLSVRHALLIIQQAQECKDHLSSLCSTTLT